MGSRASEGSWKLIRNIGVETSRGCSRPHPPAVAGYFPLSGEETEARGTSGTIASRQSLLTCRGKNVKRGVFPLSGEEHGARVLQARLRRGNRCRPLGGKSALVEEALQQAAAAGVLELAQGLRFDLADTFARHRELLADFFQG